MHKPENPKIPRRDLLFAGALIAAAKTLEALAPNFLYAETLPGTTAGKVTLYEGELEGRTVIVAAVFDPVNDGINPEIRADDSLERKNIGEMTLAGFGKTSSTLPGGSDGAIKRYELNDGTVEAVVYGFIDKPGTGEEKEFVDIRGTALSGGGKKALWIESPESADASGGGCFTADTRVMMADGGFKPIADVNLGEEVRSFDFEANRVVSNKVSKLFKVRAPNFLMINNLKVTGKHPFAVGKGEWKSAAELRAGDKVIGNSFTEIKSVKRVPRPVDVFNLSVNGTRNYYVTDGKNIFLVHNKGGDG